MSFKEKIAVTGIRAYGWPGVIVISLLVFAIVDIVLRIFGV